MHQMEQIGYLLFLARIAFILGLAFELETNNFLDRAFLTKYTVGYEKFKMYLLGESDSKPKNAEWAEKICGVSADQIKSIAEKFLKEEHLLQ